MKKILLGLFLFSFFMVYGQKLKINHKEDVKTFSFKIEKVEIKDGETRLFAKVRQRKNFSYNLSFEGCCIILPQSNDSIKGVLTSWNDKKEIYTYGNARPVDDSEEEQFTLTFPVIDFSKVNSFDLKIGMVMDRSKTEVLLKNINIKK